jgi:hypothetical protein
MRWLLGAVRLLVTLKRKELGILRVAEEEKLQNKEDFSGMRKFSGTSNERSTHLL